MGEDQTVVAQRQAEPLSASNGTNTSECTITRVVDDATTGGATLLQHITSRGHAITCTVEDTQGIAAIVQAALLTDDGIVDARVGSTLTERIASAFGNDLPSGLAAIGIRADHQVHELLATHWLTDAGAVLRPRIVDRSRIPIIAGRIGYREF